jgi:signal recognition particle GTPase
MPPSLRDVIDKTARTLRSLNEVLNTDVADLFRPGGIAVDGATLDAVKEVLVRSGFEGSVADALCSRLRERLAHGQLRSGDDLRVAVREELLHLLALTERSGGAAQQAG